MNEEIKVRVLVVEDDPDTMRGLTHLLTSRGYEVSSAEDAPAAQAVLKDSESVDVVLLDLGLPGMDGHSLLDWKATVKAASIPVIVLSAWSKGWHEDSAKAGGAVAYIEKPVKIDHLIGEIERVLSGGGVVA